MKIIFVETPYQKQDGEIKGWTVRSEMMKINQTFQEWFVEKSEYVKTHPKGEGIQGFYIYNFQPIPLNEKQSAMMIRYDYIL